LEETGEALQGLAYFRILLEYIYRYTWENSGGTIVPGRKYNAQAVELNVSVLLDFRRLYKTRFPVLIMLAWIISISIKILVSNREYIPPSVLPLQVGFGEAEKFKLAAGQTSQLLASETPGIFCQMLCCAILKSSYARVTIRTYI